MPQLMPLMWNISFMMIILVIMLSLNLYKMFHLHYLKYMNMSLKFNSSNWLW